MIDEEKSDSNDELSKSEQLFREFISRRESGEGVDPEEYLLKHPELAKDLIKLFDEFRAEKGKGIGNAKVESGKLPLTIGDFRVIREIGKGGMGTVYEAEQLSLHRKVALKILPSHLSFSDEAVRKFHREAEAGGRQSHPGIVAIHAVGEYKGVHYIAQELVEGSYTLSDRLDELRKTNEQPSGYFREVAQFIAEIADALQHAHNDGVIHRDIKPSNILLTPEGCPKVTDFGLAKVEDALSLSRTGDFAGTPYYMSPEQAMSRRIGIDKRTDIYSLGVTLYEMLTFNRPFDGKTSHEVLKKIMLFDPEDPHKANAKVPRDLSVICLKAMEKVPEKRYQGMKEFSEDIERFISGDVILAKPAGLGTRFWKRVKRNPVVSAAVGVALVAVVVFAVVVPWVIVTKEREKREAEEKARIEIGKQRNEAVAARKDAEEQARIAESEKERALAAEEEAEHQRETAEERFQEIIRLSDVKRLTDLEEEEKRLWPAYPEKIEEIKGWIHRAKELTARMSVHRETLNKLQEQALPYGEEDVRKDRESHQSLPDLLALEENREKLAARIEAMARGDRIEGGSKGEEGLSEDLEGSKHRLAAMDEEITGLEAEISNRHTWTFKDTETRWQHTTLIGLVSGLERLADEEEGLLKSMQDRLEFSMTIERRSIEDCRELWDEAIASIADEEECPQYGGLVIEEMIGFTPIGRDPDSGLWEFAHLQTGEIPIRDMEGKLFLDEKMGLVFVLIPAGTFNMGAVKPSEENPFGSPNVDPEAEGDEGPVHEVTLKPFFLSKYEMTQAQWLRFTGENRSLYQPGSVKVTLLNPVEQVSWEDCADVLYKLKLRLPSESEWEYAARAGTSTVFWTGDEKESLRGAANLADLFLKNNGGPADRRYEEWLDDGYTVHAPVGSYLANAFGLHDVHGNVWEWCQDTYRGSYEDTPVDGSANKYGGSSYRVHRGGCWFDFSFYCRSAYRYRYGPGLRYDRLGLRPSSSLP